MSDSILGSTAPEAIEIGRTYDGRRIRTNKDHMLLFGGSGSGKSSKVLMNILLDIRGDRSVFVLDTAGELAAVSAQWRSTVSKIAILNPFGVLTEYQGYDDLRGIGFNPLASLDPESEDFNVDASLLAEAMITVDSDSKNKHFDHSARALVAAVIMYVVIVARQRGEIPTMARVRELVCLDGHSLVRLAQVMSRSWCVGLRNKAAQFTNRTNEISSVVSTAQIQTEWLDDPQIARHLARNDFDFASFKREPTSVYLILPPHLMERHSKWLRLLVTSALRASMRPRRAGEPSILFMLDEFPSIGNLKIVETMWTQVRKYSVQLLASLQDMLQGQDIYKQRWGSFVANAGALLFFRPNDQTTAEWLSKRLGETTRLLQTMNESENHSGGSNSGKSFNPGGEGGSTGASKGWGLTRSVNTSPVKVPLTLPHELYGLRDGEMRVFLAGVKDGLTVEAVPYFEIENRDQRARRNPYVHDVPRRQTLPPDARRGSVPPVADPAGFDMSKWNRGNVLRFPDKQRSAPSPAPWQRAARSTTLPQPPAQRHLPPPEDWNDYEDETA
ncbi:MAG: hypothetical protein B7Z80_08615 [Rhodospirillales bacterium 20-64-7]|nr:MAG: hypothetical protein B7Z80_08615 [Rhodospirillales bacterium 20-64-7]